MQSLNVWDTDSYINLARGFIFYRIQIVHRGNKLQKRRDKALILANRVIDLDHANSFHEIGLPTTQK